MSAVLSVPVWLEVWVSEWGVLPWTLHPSLSPYHEERDDQVLQRWVAGSYFCVTWQGALKCCVIVWRCIVKLFFCFLVILRTSLLLLKNVTTLKKCFMSMCKLTGESFDVQFCFLLISCKTYTCSNKDFGGPKIFTDNGYHLPFFETKKLEMKWNKIVKIEVNHKLHFWHLEEWQYAKRAN